MKDKFFQPLVLNIPGWVAPNTLTGIRALLVFFLFGYSFHIVLFPINKQKTTFFVYFFLYGIGFFLDLLDGSLARQKGLVSPLGSFLDSMTDKLFIIPLGIYLMFVFPVLYPSMIFLFVFKLTLFVVLLCFLLMKRKPPILEINYLLINISGYLLFALLFVNDLMNWMIS